MDRAALDVALELGLTCGGWCPAGRLAEDGVISARYPLSETDREGYPARTLRNIRESDGTLVFNSGVPSSGTALTLRLAAREGKPHLLVDLGRRLDAPGVAGWLGDHAIGVLNVAGPRESKAPGIYQKAHDALRSVLMHMKDASRVA